MKRARAYIPDEIIYNILLRLPAKSILRFKSVCKSWSSLTSDPSFLQAHARRSTPTVIITECWPTVNSPNFTLHPIFSNNDGWSGNRTVIKVARMSLTLVPDYFFVRASCDGLLVLERVRKPFFFPSSNHICNPLTKEWIELPKSSSRPAGRILAFYYQPTMKEYRLLRRLNFEGDVGYQILTVGAKEWRQIECTFDGTPSLSLLYHVRKGPQACSTEPPVSMHGKLHWFSSIGLHTIADWLIMVFDFNYEKFGQLSLPKLCQGQHACPETHLLELEGKLGASIVVSAMEMDVWILEDYEKEVWFKKYRINIQGIQGLTERIMMNKFFRPLLVSNAGEAVVNFYGNLVLYDLKNHTWFKIEGTDHNKVGVFYFLHKESLVGYDFFKIG